MKTLLLLFIVNVCSFSVSTFKSYSQQSNLITVKNFLQAKEKSLQQNASKEDVEKILGFYSDSLAYEHVLSPIKKFIFHGKDDLRSGYISHLGETKNVKIELINSMKKQNIIVAEYSIQREIISNSKKENYKVISIFEFEKDGKIKRMIDYL